MLECKYDGERVQVHATADGNGGVTLRAYKRGGRVLVRPARRRQPGAFIRRPRPRAACRGAHAAAARRRAARSKCRCGCGAAVGACPRPPVRSIVLDGELLIYNETLCGGDGIEPFGAVQHLALDRGSAPSTLGGRRRHLFIFFDVLHLDGRDLTPLPLHARVAALRGALREIDTFAVTSRARRMAYEEGALTAAFARSRAERYEGLVVKAAASPYVPNERRHWCKLKHDRIPGLGDTVTLAIVGARLGDGGALGEFCLGCRDRDGTAVPTAAALASPGCATLAVRTADSLSRCGSILMAPSSASALAVRRALARAARRGALRRRGWSRVGEETLRRMRSSHRRRRRAPHGLSRLAVLPADASDTSSAASAWMTGSLGCGRCGRRRSRSSGA